MRTDTYRPRRRESQPSRAPQSLPRSTRRRRRRPPAPIPLAAGAILVLVLLVLGVPQLVRVVRRGVESRQPTYRFVAVPPDARITLGSLSATGTLRPRSLSPGSYALSVTRKGFEPLSATVTVPAEGSLAATYTLEPIPQPVKLSSHQKKASFTVVTSDGRTLSGAKLDAKLPAGNTRISLEAPGFQSWRRDVFLEEPLKLDVWLDPVGQLVRTVAAFECVPAPKGVAITPDGSRLWVTALVTQPSIEAYDRAGKVIGRVDLGESGAVEVMFNRGGTRAYASQMQSASVYEIDTRTYRVLRKFGTESAWTKVVALSRDEKTLYAANWSGDDVSEIDLVTGKCIRRFPTVDTPRGVWPTADGKSLWIAGFGEQTHVGNIAVIDLKSGKSKTVFTQRGGAMRHMAADEKRGVMFTSDMGKACVWVTDMRTRETKRFATTDSHPNTIDLSPDGKVLIVSCRGANNPKSYHEPGPEWGSVLLFDAVSGAPLDAIVGGNQCTALDLSADGKTLVFSDFLDNRLHVYDIPDHATLAAGKGGRFEAHEDEIRKPGWKASGAGSSGGGD